MDAGRTLGVRGTVAPNHFTVWLSRDDLERFAGFHDALARELADAAREHGRDEGYHFEGLDRGRRSCVDEQRRAGATSAIDAEIVGGGAGTTSTLVLPDGGRVALGDEPTVDRAPARLRGPALRPAGLAPPRRGPPRRVRLPGRRPRLDQRHAGQRRRGEGTLARRR